MSRVFTAANRGWYDEMIFPVLRSGAATPPLSAKPRAITMLHAGHFTLTNLLHEGTETLVYEAQRDQDGLPVVAKVPKSAYPSARELARLQNEYSILRDLKHPHVVKALALEPHQSGLALILERVPARPLSARLRQGRLGIESALKLAHALALVLAAVHKAGVIHKDIKPQNILVEDETDKVTLIDFGIAARLPQETQAVVPAESLEGTLVYMSPEQTGRMNRPIGHRTDFYSLGVTLYEMLTGAPPFHSSDASELVHCHIAQLPLPPERMNPEIPAALSALVMKLLAKNAEDRYQSAGGLAQDLMHCLSEWQSSGTIQAFDLGRKDLNPELQVPHTLIGREAQVSTLLSAFDRVRAGGVELLLVTGPPGIGKSSLIGEVHPALARYGGLFISGKFDPLNRSTPFSAFVAAFQELVRQLLGERPERLAAWKTTLCSALGTNGGLLTALIPGLDLIIGAQAAPEELGPTEAKNRFGLVLQDFVRSLCSPAHPLVLYLDDLQWADSASLWLVQTLLSDPARQNLLLIGAYRSSEVDAAHPLTATLDKLRQHGLAPTQLQLGPLDAASTRLLLAETLQQEASPELDALTHLVLTKTHGNPFFLLQFLRTLVQRSLLWADLDQGRWNWNLKEIAAAPLTENVMDFIAEQLHQFSQDTQHALAVSACIGYEFDLGTLARTLDQTPAATAAVLWPALRAGLLIPLSSNYRLLTGGEASDANTRSDAAIITYRFLHDRTRQVALQRLSEVDRVATHLRIGRHLHERLSSDSSSDLLFDVVSHLNAGAAQIADAAERRDLAALNQRAARLARSATAYAAATSFLQAAQSLLGADAQTADPQFDFSVRRDLAESLYLVGEFGRADQQLGALLSCDLSTIQRASILGLRLMLYTSQGRFEEGMQAGLEGLALLGVSLPSTAEGCKAALLAEVMAIEQRMASLSTDAVLDAPRLQDPEKIAVLQLMVMLSQPAYQVAPPLAALVMAKQAHHSLDHGHAALSPYGYVAYGLILAGLLGRYDEADTFGRLARQLVERTGFSEVACKVRFMYAIYAPYKHPLRETLTEFAQAQQIGLDTGDLFYASLAFSYLPLTQLRLGDPLEATRRELQRGMAAMKRTKDLINTGAHELLMQVAAALSDQTHSPTSLADEHFNESDWLARMDAMRFGAGRCLFHLYKLQLSYLHGDYAAALSFAEHAEKSLATALGMHWTTDLAFYAGLAAASALAEGTDLPQDAVRASLSRHREQVAALAAACPENAQHRLLLLDAEHARATGDRGRALDLFDRAVEQAGRSGLAQEEALANELCGRLYLQLGRRKVAALFLSEARHGYERWGAAAKVRQISEKYGALLAEGSPRPSTRAPASEPSEGSSTVWMPGRRIDMDHALKAAQAISSEIVLDKVLERVMRVVLSSAGAQRGFLVLERDGALWVKAVLTLNPPRAEIGIHTPIGDRDDFAASVVHYVARTRELVLLGHAAKDTRFSADPYIQAQRPKSILCMALQHKGRLSGVLYLENNSSIDAFTSDRVELLRILSSQATISLENGFLFDNLQSATEKLRQANDTLEQQVAQRTAQLSKALQELWSEMDLARKIQTVLVPTSPTIPGYQLAATMRPAANVGGDYFDCFHMAGADWLLIGDVSGHGISAGLCMMMVQTAVRSVVASLQKAPTVPRPSEVLALVNAAIHGNLAHIGRDQYMTVTAFCFRDGEIAFAGQHQDLLIYRAATRSVEQIETCGVWLGVLPDIDTLLPEGRVRLEPGDTMLLFTDGITEAKINKRTMLLTSGLSRLLQQSAESMSTAEETVARIINETNKFVISDDLTLVAIRRVPLESSDA